MAAPPAAAEIVSADLIQPTDRYGHAVLGDALEWGGLRLTLADGRHEDVTLPETRVFEDVEARLADITGDGLPEVIVVETDVALGASLAIYGPDGKIAATPFIGQSSRWLAPAGIADFDGDGRIEIAYVDRPHLRKELVFVRLEGDQLIEALRLPGLTNHRIGEDFISGGVRDCGQGPELILASADWTRVVQVRRGTVSDLGPMPATGLTIPPC
ncbi:VCBS repeat-containing protein [Rhodobacter sp. SY28-1]|uniref:FG-GAP repeat domain-containing protein n=1 Tax=Rhodobacter sp. SY28-1 TaxID=2562317 RepID=UPI001F0F75DD|nr:VCBS repeat-containing protein [Rhodobacter sp. SY28-1]